MGSAEPLPVEAGVQGGATSDSQAIDFGIRKVTQHRDSDNSFPKIGTGGNYSGLSSMPPAEVAMSSTARVEGENATASITIINHSNHVAFFLRAEITKGPEGEEVLPITYEDNYITLFPKESRSLQARYNPADVPGRRVDVRLRGTTWPGKLWPLMYASTLVIQKSWRRNLDCPHHQARVRPLLEAVPGPPGVTGRWGNQNWMRAPNCSYESRKFDR